MLVQCTEAEGGQAKRHFLPPRYARYAGGRKPSGFGQPRGEAQQTQRAMSFVLHRTPGIGAPRVLSDFRAVSFDAF